MSCFNRISGGIVSKFKIIKMKTDLTKTTELEKRIRLSGLMVAIKDLEDNLAEYERLNLIKHSSYSVSMELHEFIREIEFLKYRIADLIEISESWEVPE
jgi:hypothetical protein